MFTYGRVKIKNREPLIERFPCVLSPGIYRANGTICVLRSGLNRYHDCCSVQPGRSDDHWVCYSHVLRFVHSSHPYSSRSIRCRDRCCHSLVSCQRSGWLVSCYYHPYSSHNLSDVPCRSPGKNTGVGFHILLQGIFPIQRSNPHLLRLLHWQAGSLPLAPDLDHTLNRTSPQSLACLGLVLRRGGAPMKSLSRGCHPSLGAWLTAE